MLQASSESGGPFALIDGLPVHPLVVHLAVVMVPLAAIGLIVMAAWPSFSRRYGAWVAAAAAIGVGASFVAKESGEKLEDIVGDPKYDHAELGDVMPVIASVLFLAAVGLYLLDRTAKDVAQSRRILRIVAAVLAVVIAAGNIVWIYRVGHSGAKSVWESEVSEVSNTTGGDGDSD